LVFWSIFRCAVRTSDDVLGIRSPRSAGEGRPHEDREESAAQACWGSTHASYLRLKLDTVLRYDTQKDQAPSGYFAGADMGEVTSHLTKVAIVGLGRWARVLARAATKSSDLKIVAGYSRSEESRSAFAREFGIPAAPDLTTILSDPEIKGVLLTVPNEQHLPLAIEVAKAGKQVYTEKPIASTLEEGLAIEALEKTYGVSVTVGHSARLMSGVRAPTAHPWSVSINDERSRSIVGSVDRFTCTLLLFWSLTSRCSRSTSRYRCRSQSDPRHSRQVQAHRTVHHAQHCRGRISVRPRRGDVARRDRRGWHDLSRRLNAATRLYAAALAVGAAALNQGRAAGGRR